MKRIIELLTSIKFWTITSAIATIIFGFTQIFNEAKNNINQINKNEITEKNLLSRFDDNPSHETNFGFLSINTFVNNGDNKFDTLLFSELPENQEFIVFIDFRNKLPGTIKDAYAKIEFPKKGITSSAKFTAYLSASNSKTINDEVLLTDLPKKWKIEFVKGELDVDSHKLSNGNNCNETFNQNFLRNYQIDNLNEMYIGDLRDYAQGWCDQGFVILTFKLINLTKDTINNKYDYQK